MTNADLFKKIFGLYAEEFWSMPLSKMTAWLVADAPTTEPERKKGKWVDGYVKHIENGELRNCRQCSECGSVYFVYDRYNAVEEVPKYCPNCGAEMKGGDE